MEHRHQSPPAHTSHSLMLLMSSHLHCSPRNKAQAFKQHKVCFTDGRQYKNCPRWQLPAIKLKRSTYLVMDLLLATCALLCSIFALGGLANGQMVIFHLNNKCPFPVWPAAAPNAGHPVIADGGFLLPPNRTKRVHAPPTWNGRFWGRTGCDFTTTSKPGCQTGDCQGLLSCNGTVGTPPATLVEVALQEDQSKPSFYDVSVVDGYNLPIAVSTKPAHPKCWVGGCTKSINSVCPQELQVLDHGGAAVVACKSACLAFDLDVFCCRNSYGKPETCKPSMYSAMFKDACPSYFSYAYDTPPPLVNCYSREYAITFCPSRWGSSLLSQ